MIFSAPEAESQNQIFRKAYHCQFWSLCPTMGIHTVALKCQILHAQRLNSITVQTRLSHHLNEDAIMDSFLKLLSNPCLKTGMEWCLKKKTDNVTRTYEFNMVCET